MARHKRTEKNVWDRFVIWMRRNQRIIWVLLLILVCFSFGFVGPVQQFFTGTPDLGAVDRINGRVVTQLDFKVILDRLSVVSSVLQRAWLCDYQLPGVLMAALASIRELNPLDYYALRDEADKLGMMVSSRELGDYIRVLWEKNDAFLLANEEVRSKKTAEPKDNAEAQRLEAERRAICKEKEAELQRQPFDVKSWAEIISGGQRVRLLPRDFEDTLQDVILIAKLEEYIRSSVKVTPQEVYEEYQKERELRKLSWTEFPLTDALKENVAKTISDDKIKLYYESNKTSLELPPSFKASWLLVPKDHFEKIAAEKITDADLQQYLKQNRNDFRRPAVLSAEASFLPLSAQEKAEMDKKLYFSLDEVKEKVREKVLENRTRADMVDLAEKLRARLYPPKPATGEAPAPGPLEPATFAGLIKEFGFLKTGSTEFVSKDEAKAAFGDGYGPEAKRWFDAVARDSAKPNVKAPERAVNGDKGMVFYAGLDYRKPMLPLYREVQGKVRDAVAKQEALSLLDEALKQLASQIDSRQTDFAAVTKVPVQVQVGGEKVEVPPKPVETALAYVGKYGSVMVPKKTTEEKKEGAEESTTQEAGEPPAEETFLASSEIRDVGFTIKDKGQTKVASSEKTGAAYLVHLDDTILPDPKGFEEQKAWLEAKLVREQQNAYFGSWRTEVRRQARGITAPVAGESPKPPDSPEAKKQQPS